jgi:ABC-type long-subunit fatty acid transport system fused permease/ATPase subunit
VEQLGASLIEALLTLLAFLPILWELSAYVKKLPLVGEVPQALVFVAFIWAAIGTAALLVPSARSLRLRRFSQSDLGAEPSSRLGVAITSTLK